jgi:phytoene dehydrogenase-like protein
MKRRRSDESAFAKTASGDYANLHTGIINSKPGFNPGEPDDTEKLAFYQNELKRMTSGGLTPYKSHIAHIKSMIKRYGGTVVSEQKKGKK